MPVTRKVNYDKLNRTGEPLAWTQEFVTSADASGAGVVLVAATSGVINVVRNVVISFGAAITAKLTDGVADITGTFYGAANTTIMLPGTYAAGAANRAIRLVASGAGNISVTFDYDKEV